MEWIDASLNNKPAWCYYLNDSLNSKNYGKLYNWYAVNDPRGLAPKGWKIPTSDDWELLINTNGGYLDAGVKLKNTFGWDNKNGSNESGFAANAGGDRAWNTSLFSSLRKYGFWWTSSVEKEIRAKEIGKPTIYGEVFVHYGIGKDRIFKSGVGEQGRGDGTSVRLIKE